MTGCGCGTEGNGPFSKGRELVEFVYNAQEENWWNSSTMPMKERISEPARGRYRRSCFQQLSQICFRLIPRKYGLSS